MSRVYLSLFEFDAFRRFILAWVSGLIWSEVKQLWDVGLEEYVNDMWNVIDFVTNSLYVATAALRVVAYYRVKWEIEKSGSDFELQREQWDTWDPMLISEGLFSAANIFRSFPASISLPNSLFPPPFLPVNFAKRCKRKKKKNVIAKRFLERRPFARRLVKNPRDAIREIALST